MQRIFANGTLADFKIIGLLHLLEKHSLNVNGSRRITKTMCEITVLVFSNKKIPPTKRNNYFLLNEKNIIAKKENKAFKPCAVKDDQKRFRVARSSVNWNFNDIENAISCMCETDVPQTQTGCFP